MEKLVAGRAQTDQIVEIIAFQFPASVLVGTVMRLQIVLAVAQLASVISPSFDGQAYLLPVIGLEV